MVKPLKGEPRRMAYISKEVKVAISIVPDPIQDVDHGCKLSAIRLSPKFELALIEGSGFAPNSNVQFTTSGDLADGIIATADNQGRFTTSDAILITGDGKIAESYPLILKTDGSGFVEAAGLKNNIAGRTGNERVRVVGQGCDLKVNYEWGVF